MLTGLLLILRGLKGVSELPRTCPATGKECPIDTRLDEAIEVLPVSEQMGFMMVIQKAKKKRVEAACNGPLAENVGTGTQITCANEALADISRLYKDFRQDSDYSTEMPETLSYIIKNQ